MAGLALGLGSGLAPGPLLGLSLSTSLARGARAGIQVAVSPLVTDTIIIILTLTVVSQLPAVVVTALTLLGSAVVAYFAWETWQAARSPGLANRLSAPDTVVMETSGEGSSGGSQPGSQPESRLASRPAWLQGIAVNFLNPAAWLFWATAGSALLIDFWRASPSSAVLFLAAFYLMLVGTKVVLALAVGAGRTRVSMRTYRWLLAGSAVLLAAVAVGLAASGVAAL